MVKRIIGKANGFKLIFEYVGTGRWEATVPSNLGGEYVVEIWAEDDAGNISYVTKMLYVVSKHTMQAYLIPYEIIGNIENKGYSAGMNDYDLQALLCDKEFAGMINIKDLFASMGGGEIGKN